MKASHSPGPWEIDDKWGSCAEHPEWAAIRIDPVRCTSVSGHIGAANARLISAAPDLLEALQHMVESCPAIYPGGGEAHERAKAAINKATGGEL